MPQGSNFRQTINDNMLVVVMIETVEGVNNALEIASQPGVDVVIQGNNDLGPSIFCKSVQLATSGVTSPCSSLFELSPSSQRCESAISMPWSVSVTGATLVDGGVAEERGMFSGKSVRAQLVGAVM